MLAYASIGTQPASQQIRDLRESVENVLTSKPPRIVLQCLF
jgi:hypothetical protein